MSDLKETIKKLDKRYNYEILKYLRDKFQEEPESAIREAAAFISHRTAIVVNDISAEMSRQWEKSFCDYIRKEKRNGWKCWSASQELRNMIWKTDRICMSKILVDVMPKVVEECPFAEYVQMTSKNKSNGYETDIQKVR